MGSPIARKGDSHSGVCDHGYICCPHSVTGTITAGSINVKANNLDVARVGDAVTHNCPHCGTGSLTSGSSTVKANGIAVARQGDPVGYPGGSGTINTGSSNVKVG